MIRSRLEPPFSPISFMDGARLDLADGWVAVGLAVGLVQLARSAQRMALLCRIKEKKKERLTFFKHQTLISPRNSENYSFRVLD